MDTFEEELFGMLLKQFRERSGLKQLALAYLIGKRNRASIDAWERGLYVPSTPETVLSLAKALRLSESETDRLLMAAHYPPRYQRPNTQETVSLAGHREEIPVSPPTLSPCWNVPHHRTPFFTGREEVLQCLHDTLTSDKTVALTQPQAISGLGGIGKTQTAIEYAYRYHDEYQAVLWVKADSREILTSDFVSLAKVLNLPEQEEKDQNHTINAIKRWLQDHVGWLLILDNIEDLEMMKELLPTRAGGHILLTTRRQATGELAQQVEIEKMKPDEGALFLLRRAKFIRPDMPLDHTLPANRNTAREISEVLDGLPLALDQAGAYIEETRCGLSHYLDLYQIRRDELLRRRGKPLSSHPESVATTFSLSFQKVQQANAAAAELLLLCTFLYPDAIPVEMITDGAPDLGPLLQPVASEPLKLDEAIAELLRYSLVRRDAVAQMLSIHRLVQVVLQSEMDENTRQQWAERTVQVVSRAFPESAFPVWERCQRILPQALACATIIEQENMESLEGAELLRRAGDYLHDRTQYTQSETLLQKALDIHEKIFGPNHLAVANNLNSLAELHRSQGKYAQAEPFYRRALMISERTVGPDHPNAAIIQNNLALLYQAWGKYNLAEPLYQRALNTWVQTDGIQHPNAIRCLGNLAILCLLQSRYEQAESILTQVLVAQQQTLGRHHPDVAQSLTHLASAYNGQGRYDQAEQLLLQALTICEQALGDSHPDVAQSLTRLAHTYEGQGKYNLAEPLLQRALGIYRLALGPNSPDVARNLNDLASLYHTQHKYDLAESLYTQALGVWEQTIGLEHPHVASSFNNLAMLSYDLGLYPQAELLYQQALAIWQVTVGPDHPEFATGLSNLAEVYRAQGKYKQSELLYRKALALHEKASGPDQLAVASTANNLALLYLALGRYDQAEQLYKRSQEIFERTLGVEHPEVAKSLHNLALLYLEQQNYEQAEPLVRRALDIRRRFLGSDDPEMAQSLYSLAHLYLAQGEYALAESLLEEALDTQTRILGPDHHDVAISLNNLAEVCRLQGKYGQAEQLLTQALATLETLLGSNHPEVATSLNNLAALYHSQGKYEQAEPLIRRALAMREQALGPGHPHVAQSLINYAALLRETDREDEAIECEARAKIILAKTPPRAERDT